MFRNRYRLGECRDCGTECVFRRRVPRHELHLVLTIGTLGLWGLCWIITLFAARWEQWRCTDCRLPQVEDEGTVSRAQCSVLSSQCSVRAIPRNALGT